MPPADRDSSRAWGGGSLVSEQPGQKWRLSSPGESLSSGMRVAWRGTHCQGAGVLLLGAGRPLMASALGPVAGSPAALRALLRDTGGERRPAALLWGQTPRSSAETALRAGGACGLRAAPDAPDARRVQGAGRRGAHSPKRWGALHSPGLWPETSALILAVYARGLCSTKDVSQRTCHVKGGSAGGGVATGQRGRGASVGEEPARERSLRPALRPRRPRTWGGAEGPLPHGTGVLIRTGIWDTVTGRMAGGFQADVAGSPRVPRRGEAHGGAAREPPQGGPGPRDQDAGGRLPLVVRCPLRGARYRHPRTLTQAPTSPCPGSGTMSEAPGAPSRPSPGSRRPSLMCPGRW